MPKLERMPEDHIYQAYGIYLLQNQHRFIRRLKKLYEPSVHGHKTWGSSFLLMDYLRDEPIKKKSSVMELGSGWGPGAVYCAAKFKADVTAVDMDKDVFPFLDVLAALNDVEVKTKKAKFSELSSKQLGAHKVIVGSDICFWDSLADDLLRLMKRAFNAGVERIIITDPGRPPFYELCDRAAKKYNAELTEWYATEPSQITGEVLEVRPR